MTFDTREVVIAGLSSMDGGFPMNVAFPMTVVGHFGLGRDKSLPHAGRNLPAFPLGDSRG